MNPLQNQSGNWNLQQGGTLNQGTITTAGTLIGPNSQFQIRGQQPTTSNKILIKDASGKLKWVINGERPGTGAERYDYDSEKTKPAVEFESLPEETKQKAREKLKPFDDIVQPKLNQKQEHHITPSTETESFNLSDLFAGDIEATPGG